MPAKIEPYDEAHQHVHPLVSFISSNKCKLFSAKDEKISHQEMDECIAIAAGADRFLSYCLLFNYAKIKFATIAELKKLVTLINEISDQPKQAEFGGKVNADDFDFMLFFFSSFSISM